MSLNKDKTSKVKIQNKSFWLYVWPVVFLYTVSCSLTEKKEKSVPSLEFKDLKTDFERGNYYYINKDYKEGTIII